MHEGDTLSGLAEQAGVEDWTTAWPANEDRSEPGGQRLTDPNLIEPGWTVMMPGATAQAAPGPTQPSHTAPNRGTAKHGTPPHDRPASTPHTTPHQLPTHTPSATRPSTPPQRHRPDSAPPRLSRRRRSRSPAPAARRSDSSEIVPVAEWAASLSAGGGLLAGGLFLALRRYRRRQFRHRGAGRAIAGPAPKHGPLEKVLVTDGSTGMRDVEFIDRALRGLALSLAAADGRLPSVLAARLTEHHLDLVLADPQLGAPPAPWVSVSPTSWVVEKSADVLPLESFDQVPAAPYPTLVSVGYTAAGEEWLIDLEQAGALVVDGDQARCMDLSRFIAAELAHNVWSDHLTVTLSGQLGPELAELNPSRLIFNSDVQAVAAAAANDVRANREVADGEHVDVLHGRLHSVSGDTWMPHVLLVALDSTENAAAAAAIDSLLETVAERSSRTASAVVLLPGGGASASTAGLQLHVDKSGTLSIPLLNVSATAQQLPQDQAVELAHYLAAVRDSVADVAMPPAPPEEGAASYTDLTGAVLPKHTVPRREQPAITTNAGNAGTATEIPTLAAAVPAAASVLPNPTSSYLLSTAATSVGHRGAGTGRASRGKRGAVGRRPAPGRGPGCLARSEQRPCQGAAARRGPGDRGRPTAGGEEGDGYRGCRLPRAPPPWCER